LTKKFFVLLFLLRGLAWGGDGPAVDSLFTSAGTEYDRADYRGAVEDYGAILNAGFESLEVYYNMGNALFKEGEVGRAIASYRRALKLNPRDAETKTNLAFAKQFTIDRLEYPRVSFFASLFKGILSAFNAEEAFLVWTALLWAALCLWGFHFLARSRTRALSTLGTVVVFLLLISSIPTGAKIYSQETETRGVLVSPEAKIYSGPGEDFTLQFTGHEGLEFSIEERREAYYRITLDNGVKGWVKSDLAEVI
jgi:tetratricopeptide (TPR) repeat protein